MKVNKKKCKGAGKAKGFGCGKEGYYIRYGLNSCCYSDWLLNTPEGKELLNKSEIKAKKKIEREIKIERKKQKDEVRKKSYYEKQLEIEVNTIVRLIDEDNGCISCSHGWDGNWTRRKNAGHRLSVGASPHLRYNFFNIYLQCSICNTHKSSNEREYDKGLFTHHGVDILEKAKSLSASFKSLHLSKEDLKEKIVIAKGIKKEILSGKDYTRNELNLLLKIYNHEILP